MATRAWHRLARDGEYLASTILMPVGTALVGPRVEAAVADQ